jgi:hypothetical protein
MCLVVADCLPEDGADILLEVVGLECILLFKSFSYLIEPLVAVGVLITLIDAGFFIKAGV